MIIGDSISIENFSYIRLQFYNIMHFFLKICNLVVVIAYGFLFYISYYNYINVLLIGMKLFIHTFII